MSFASFFRYTYPIFSLHVYIISKLFVLYKKKKNYLCKIFLIIILNKLFKNEKSNQKFFKR